MIFFINDVMNQLINDYENLAKGVVIYNEIYQGFLFNSLTEEKMEENIIGTYKNICNYGFRDEDNIEFINKMYLFLKKIIKLFNKDDITDKLDEIRLKYLNIKNKNFYIGFCFFAEGMRLLERSDNLLYKFLYHISDIDFKSIITDKVFLDGCLFLQRIIRLIKEVLFIHWKKNEIIERNLLMGF